MVAFAFVGAVVRSIDVVLIATGFLTARQRRILAQRLADELQAEPIELEPFDDRPDYIEPIELEPFDDSEPSE